MSYNRDRAELARMLREVADAAMAEAALLAETDQAVVAEAGWHIHASTNQAMACVRDAANIRHKQVLDMEVGPAATMRRQREATEAEEKAERLRQLAKESNANANRLYRLRRKAEKEFESGYTEERRRAYSDALDDAKGAREDARHAQRLANRAWLCARELRARADRDLDVGGQAAEAHSRPTA